MTDELAAYDYHLPDDLVARFPTERRDGGRLLVVDRKHGTLAHRQIRDLPELLAAGDCLVLNNSKVLPARLLGRRVRTGGGWEGLFLATTPAGDWRLLSQTRGKIVAGESVEIRRAHHPESTERLVLNLFGRDADGIWTARPESDGDAFDLLETFGTVPLPPYIGRALADRADFERYQTTYAQEPGSVAAPTAGLHLTRELLAEFTSWGVRRVTVTLHVGIGTFRPISVSHLAQHRMHSEWCEVLPGASEQISEARSAGCRIIAVGTTTVRTLETAARGGRLETWRGPTDLFIRPPFRFNAVDALLTNFHLPRSTLLVLVSAFAGDELVRLAYAEAIHEKYRFYSYGDAMLIL